MHIQHPLQTSERLSGRILRYFRGTQFDFITSCWCCYLSGSKEASFSFLFEDPEIIFPNMKFSMEMQKQTLEHNMCIIPILPSSRSEPITLCLAWFPPYPPSCAEHPLLLPFVFLFGGLSLVGSLETKIIFFEDENTYRQRKAGLCSKHCILALLASLGSLVSWISLTSPRICSMAQPGSIRCNVSSCKPLLAANTLLKCI